MKSVYLCGPITGCTYDECRFGWRAKVYRDLTGAGIECWSPMRWKPRSEFSEASLASMSPMGSEKHVLSTPRGITRRDRMDTTGADMIFCNVIGTRKISVGSMIEFGWADAHGIPILLCMEPGNPHEHGMVEDVASWIVPTLEEGLEYAKAILTPSI